MPLRKARVFERFGVISRIFGGGGVGISGA
jgi:hypothetical protein